MRSLVHVRWLWLLAGSCACTLAADRVRAQPIGSMVDLKTEFDKTSTRRGKLLSGEEQPAAADKKVAEATAKYFIYRITHKTADPNHLPKVQFEFEKFAIGIDPKKKNQLFVNQFLGPALVACMKEVLAVDPRENPTVVINACNMLPAMARLRADDIGNYLIFMVQDSQTNEIVRLHALKAFKETLPVRVFDPDVGGKEDEARKVRDIKHVEALVKFIERPVKANDPGDVAVYRFLRREAITSLANAGAPAVALVKKGKIETVEGAVAPTLLRVLVTDGLQPPASMQEKIEAAVGLCSMKYPDLLKYEPEIAVYHVGRTLAEMVSEYNKDYANFGAKDKTRKLPMIAWMTESKRLELGLKDMVKASGGNKKAMDLEKMFNPVLKRMQKYDAPNLDRAEYNRLEQQNLPKSGAVFKTLKSEVVPLN